MHLQAASSSLAPEIEASPRTGLTGDLDIDGTSQTGNREDDPLEDETRSISDMDDDDEHSGDAGNLGTTRRT